MDKDRVLLNVKRFRQKPSECALAAASSLANFYDSTVEYENVRELLKTRERGKGLYTSQQGRLLNELGFGHVTIVTADLTLIDFSWRKLSKKRLIRKLKEFRGYYGHIRDPWSKDYVNDMVEWLEEETCNNRLVIDYDFAKYIRKSLDKGRPVGASIAWTSLFRLTKGYQGESNDIKGEEDDHAVVIRGYDEDGVFVVDSHYLSYRGRRLKKYHNGYYKIPWEKFLVNIPRGDLVLIR